MKIKNDLLRIQASDYDERGQRLEPEEKPAERILPVDAPVSGQLDGQLKGNLRATVNVQGTVGQFAMQVRQLCAGCRWFDPRAFQEYRRANELSKAKQKEMNAIRAALLETGVADFDESNPLDVKDVEAQLASMGICRAITEAMRDPMIVHPESTCPEEYRSQSSPEGFYVPLNMETEKIGSAAFDQVMRQATGKG